MRDARIEYFKNNPDAALKISERMSGDSSPNKHLDVKQKRREFMLSDGNPMKNEITRKKHLESVNTPHIREKRSLNVRGNKNPSKRPEVNLKRSISLKKTYKSQELRNKIGLINKGRKFSYEHRRRLRIAQIEQIERNFNNGNQISPNFNPDACNLIDKYGLQNGYSFQHAMNGGEYYISELGYWVDGYDKEKNVVIEYYEKEHERKKDRDENRKQEIINLLNCQFIELKEGRL
jgi:hypothetical protein